MIPRLILIGGFLGAGKTTLVAAMLQRLATRNLRIGVVTNDQAADLVDTRFLDALHVKGSRIAEVAGGCFCCCFNEFMARLTDLQRDEPADLLIGEPVGSCTDLAATVVRPLQQLYADRFRTAPYSVLVDPLRWRQSQSLAQWPLPEQALYIYRLQIEEADAILLNKTDMLGNKERQLLLKELAHTYPGRPIFPISALTGDGVDAWLSHLLLEEERGRAGGHRIDVDYDRYAQGEADLGWLNLTAEVAAVSPQNWTVFCQTLLSRLRDRCREQSIEVAHAKVVLTGEGRFLLANLSAVSSAPTVRGTFSPRIRKVSLTLNLRAGAAPEMLRRLLLSVLEEAPASGMELTLLRDACFRPGRPKPRHHLA